MHRRPSILSYRPKTSSAADDDTHTASERTMKRTASQTFNTHYHDVRDAGMALDAVSEGSMILDDLAAQHSHASSLTRAFGAVTGQFTRQKTRRRLSSFSSATSAATPRRGSIQSFIESLPSTTATRKPSIEQQRAPLQHQDSGIPSCSMQSQGPRPFSLRRFGSMRRRQAASGPAGDVTKTAFFAPTPVYPQTAPGAAARQAAAAANQDRQNQLREQEHTRRFLNGLLPSSIPRDDDIKDNESGVDMTYSSPVVRADSVLEKKMGTFTYCSPVAGRS
jgi:F-box and WD-40 domain protein 1/11